MNGPMLFSAAIVLLGFSLVLFLSGFSTSYWLRVNVLELHYGLWTICSETRCNTIDGYLGGSPGGHIYFARFGGVVQLMGTVLGLLLLALFSFKDARQQWAKAAFSLALLAGTVGFLGAVVFISREKSADYTNDVDVLWSGIVVVIASLMQNVAGICIFLPVHRGQVEYTAQ